MVKLSTLTKKTYKPKDVADMMDISVRTIQRWDDKNNIFERGDSNRRYVKKSKLIEFLKEHNAYEDDTNYINDVFFVSDNDKIINLMSEYTDLSNIKMLYNTNKTASEQLNALVCMIMSNTIKRLFMGKLDLSDEQLEMIKMMCSYNKTQLIIVP